MIAITHNEIRRHPLWRKALIAPASPGRARAPGVTVARAFVVIGALLLAALVLALLL